MGPPPIPAVPFCAAHVCGVALDDTPAMYRLCVDATLTSGIISPILTPRFHSMREWSCVGTYLPNAIAGTPRGSEGTAPIGVWKSHSDMVRIAAQSPPTACNDATSYSLDG